MRAQYCVKNFAIVGNTDCYSQCTSSFHWSSTALEESCTFSARQDKNLPWSDSSGIKITVVVDTFPSGLICKIKDKSIYTMFQVWLNLDIFLEYSALTIKAFSKMQIFLNRNWLFCFSKIKIGQNFRLAIEPLKVEKLVILKWRFRFDSLYFLTAPVLLISFYKVQNN